MQQATSMVARAGSFAVVRPRPATLLLLLAVLLAAFSCTDTDAPAQLAWQFHYDDAGRLTSILEPSGRAVSMSYEHHANGRARRVTRTAKDHPSAISEYDERGRRTSMHDALGIVRYTHDDFGQVLTAEREGLPKVGFVYDAEGKLAGVRVGGVSVSYARDALGRLARIETPAGAVSYRYASARGIVERTLPSGVRTTQAFHPDGTLRQIEHSAPGDQLIARSTYQYRADGLIESIEELTRAARRSDRFEYDAMKRLVSWTNDKAGALRYEYDPLGNRSLLVPSTGEAVRSVYDWTGCLVLHAGERARCDPNGNVFEYFRGADKVFLEYGLNQQVSALTRADRRVEYTYDGDGNPVRRTLEGKATTFVVDPRAPHFRPLAAILPDGQMTVFVWEPEASTIVGTVQGSSGTFFLHDHLDSIRVEVDAKGLAVAEHRYEPFGTPEAGTTAGLGPRFAGLFYDADAGLYLTRARAYDPRLGRFLQRDPRHATPSDDPATLSSYAYANNDPLGTVDIDGREPHEIPASWRGKKLVMLIVPKPANVPRGQTAAATEWQIHDIAGKLKAARATVDHFRSRALNTKEFYQPGPNGGRADSSSFDLVAETDTTVYFVNQVTTLADKQTMDRREATQYVKYARELNRIASEIGSPEPQLPKIGVPKWAKEAVDAARKPTNVGGVALRGASKLIEGLGPIRGVVLDANGRFVVLAADGTDAKVPPLRLDDIVTVFRSVYDHGDAPSVSIDPDPQNPHGATFHVRYGKGTENTYVGWVLFEADRVMKAYTIGTDNESSQPVRSKIPGYEEVLKKDLTPPQVVDAGDGPDDPGAPPSPGGGKNVWERFWILPDHVTRKQDDRRDLTLLDIPLRVNTEADVLVGGKMEKAPGARSSPFAEAFTEWFTRNYDAIDQECTSKLPSGHGMGFDQVHVFSELRRIALLSAIAESLRDRGIPLPGWMRDYPVASFPAPERTKAITAQARYRKEMRLYGGVTLAPRSAALLTVPASKEEHELARRVAESLPSGSAPAAAGVKTDQGAYRAVALPGSDTRDVGACVVEDTDLIIPEDGEDGIRVTRSFHSFFQGGGVFGAAWVQNLPRLFKRVGSVERDDHGATTRFATELVTPLGWPRAWFSDKRAAVPELNGTHLVPDTGDGVLAMVGAPREDADGREQVFLTDGRSWTFNDAGQMVVARSGSTALRYRWDDSHRLRAIESAREKDSPVEARFDYDDAGRITVATGSDGKVVRYSYGADDLLTRVERPGETMEYKYKDGLLVEELVNGKPRRQFEYGPGGRLRVERTLSGNAWEETKYDVVADAGRTKMSITGGTDTTPEVIEFDRAFRPVRRSLPDGTILEWDRQHGGVVTKKARIAGGDTWTGEERLNERETTWRSPSGTTFKTKYDAAGRLTASWYGDALVEENTWTGDGRLLRSAGHDHVLNVEYRENGSMEALRVSSPVSAGAGKTGGSLSLELDARGRLERLRDESGEEIQVEYDARGQVERITSKRGTVETQTDGSGRLLSAQTSWGAHASYTYDPAGEMARSETRRGDQIEYEEYSFGKITKRREFDGTETTFSYSGEAGANARLKSIVLPNKLAITYEHDADGRVTAASVGDLHRVRYALDERNRVVGVTLQPIQGAMTPEGRRMLIYAAGGLLGMYLFGVWLRRRSERGTKRRPTRVRAAKR